MHTLATDTTKADYYKRLILSNLPNSEYAKLLENEGKEYEDTDEKVIEDFYVQAYDLYQEKSFRRSLRLTDEGITKFSKSEYAPKFHLLKAFNTGKVKKKKAFIETLKAVISLFPNTEEATEANKILAIIDKPIKTDSSNNTDDKEEDSPYTSNMNQQHRYILLVPNEGVDINNLRNKVSDFNKNFFSLSSLRTKTIYLNPQEQMMLVSDFESGAKAITYFNTLMNQKLLVPYFSGKEFKHFVISNENFQVYYQDKNYEQYAKFFKKEYLAETSKR